MLYTTMKQANKILEMKKLEMRAFTLVLHMILRLIIYYVDSWLLTLEAKQVKKVI